LSRRLNLRIQYGDICVTGEVATIKRQDFANAMDVHCRHDPSVMGHFAFTIKGHDQPLPLRKNIGSLAGST
jgi:hypothetical protein